jgi:hypothetical protein
MPSIFINKSVKPNKVILSEVLKTTYKLWEEIRNSLTEEHGKMLEEWKYYGPKTGWLLKLFYKKRNLFFLIPNEKYFTLAFVFGDNAVSEIEQSGLPEKIKEELRNTKKYAEGRGLRLEVKKQSDIKYINKLVAIKINN